MNLQLECILWTCVGIFVITSIITILSILNVIKIKEEYSKKLFYALIIQVITAGVITFKSKINENPTSFLSLIDGKPNILRITSPTTNVVIENGNNLFVNGFAYSDPKYKFKGKLVLGTEKFELKDFKRDERNNFSCFTDSIKQSYYKKKGTIIVGLFNEKNNEPIVSDTTEIYLTVK